MKTNSNYDQKEKQQNERDVLSRRELIAQGDRQTEALIIGLDGIPRLAARSYDPFPARYTIERQ